MNRLQLDTSRIVAIVCGLALLGAWILGMASRPERRTAGAAVLDPVVPFSPPPGYVGSHTYGLWTLKCSERSRAPASPALEKPRCHMQGLINARLPDNRIVSVVAIRIVRAGPQSVPFLVIYLPARSRGDGSILFAVDENNAFRAPVKACAQTTCRIESALPAEALNQLLLGKVLKLQMAGPTPDQPAKFVYPLHGFRESFDALTAVHVAG